MEKDQIIFENGVLNSIQQAALFGGLRGDATSPFWRDSNIKESFPIHIGEGEYEFHVVTNDGVTHTFEYKRFQKAFRRFRDALNKGMRPIE